MHLQIHHYLNVYCSNGGPLLEHLKTCGLSIGTILPNPSIPNKP